MERRPVRTSKKAPSECVTRVKRRAAGNSPLLPTTRMALIGLTMFCIGFLVVLTSRLEIISQQGAPPPHQLEVPLIRTLRGLSPRESRSTLRVESTASVNDDAGTDDDDDVTTRVDPCSPRAWLNDTDFPGMDLSQGYVASASAAADCCVACVR